MSLIGIHCYRMGRYIALEDKEPDRVLGTVLGIGEGTVLGTVSGKQEHIVQVEGSILELVDIFELVAEQQ